MREYPVLNKWPKPCLRWLQQVGVALLLCFAVVSCGIVCAPIHAKAHVLRLPVEHGGVTATHEPAEDGITIKHNHPLPDGFGHVVLFGGTIGLCIAILYMLANLWWTDLRRQRKR